MQLVVEKVFVMQEKHDRRILGIRFQTLGKLYHFSFPPEQDIRSGDFVIVSTSRGKEMGKVITVIEQGHKKKNGRIKPIERRATPQDLVLSRMWQRRELEATINCRAKAAELGFQAIKITKAEYSYDGSRLMFLYSSEGDEKINLNPQEITGMCGRLRCCLLYEYEQYVEARKKLPKKKKRVVTPLGEGKVIDVLPLKEAVIVAFEDGKRVEFLKDEVQPYEELKALEQKASEPCDRHSDGGCNCKDKGSE